GDVDSVAQPGFDRLDGCGDRRVDQVKLGGREALQDEGGGVHTARRAANAKTDAREVLRAEPLDNIGQTPVATGAALLPDAQRAKRQVEIVEDHQDVRR